MKDFVKAYVKTQYGRHDAITSAAGYRRETIQFIDRVGHLAKRFEDVVVCIDCNEVEGLIKIRIRADKYFTFHPWEIRRAYIPRPKQKHVFVEEHMTYYSRFYAAHEARLVGARKRVLMDLIDSAGAREQFWGASVEPTLTFSQEDLYVSYPTFDSGKRVAEGLIKGDPVLQGTTWIVEHDKKFLELVANGITDEAIAKVLGRTASAIRIRREALAQSSQAKFRA